MFRRRLGVLNPMLAAPHPLGTSVVSSAIATLFALGGIASGVGLRRIALHRLSLLVAAAMGTLLAVTLFDVLPDAKQSLPWPGVVLASASGYLLLWAIGRYVYHVCPACAVNEITQDASPDATRAAATLLMISLSLHCTMDGLGLAFGNGLLGHADMGLMWGLSVHKIPEGLALILLPLGAGFKAGKAIRWASGVEGMTIVGGLIGAYLVQSASPTLLGVVFAHLGGSFLYLVATATRGTLGHHTDKTRYASHAIVSGLSFASTAVFLGVLTK